MKKIFALMLSVIVALTSISTLNINYAVNAAGIYQKLSSLDTTLLTEKDFTFDADRNKDATTFSVSSSDAGVLIQVTAPSTENCGNAYYVLNESFKPDYNSKTVIRFNAVETNKYIQYKPFLQDSDGTRYHISNYITDGNTLSVNGGDEIVLMIDWSASDSKVYRNGEAVTSFKSFPLQTALSGGMQLGFALSSDKPSVTRSFTVSDLKIWETSADTLSCTVENTASGTATLKFNMPLFYAPVVTLEGNTVAVSKVNDVTYSIDTSNMSAGNHTISVSAESVTTLNSDYVIKSTGPSAYRNIATFDTTSLTSNDFTFGADRNKEDTTFTVSSNADGVLLEVTAPSTESCGNAYYTLNESFTPNYNSTTVIRFNAVETSKYTRYKPFLQDADGTKYHISNYITDESTSSVAGGDEIVIMIDWSDSSSRIYRNGELQTLTLKTFPAQTALSNGIKLGFSLSSDKPSVTRSFTVSDLNVWETAETALSCTVEPVTSELASVKFNMPLFGAPVIKIGNNTVAVTKVDDVTYTFNTSDIATGNHTVFVTATSVVSLDAYETTLAVSDFDPNDTSVAKLSYRNGVLYLTKRPGATFSARIIKVEYNDDNTIENCTVLAKGITNSTSIYAANYGGVRTKYFVWSEGSDGNPLGIPLGTPIEVREPKYTEEYAPTIYTLSNGSDVITNNITTEAGKVYYARVYAYGEDSNHSLTISIKEGDKVTQTYSYFVATQLAAVYLPFTATGNETTVEVTSDNGGTFYVSEPEIEESDYKYYQTKSGTYLIASDEWTYDTVTVEEGQGLLCNPNDGDDRGVTVNINNRTMDSVIVGDYMYALRNGRIHILERNDDTFAWVGATQYYGELREMDVTSDKKGIVVVGRNYGVFAFDISNPTSPELVSHIDSLEMSSGLDIFGDYLYVADRGFGITIFNIKDLKNPVCVANIPTGETQNVCYSNGYVYAGVWAESVVRICDVRDVDNPKILEPIKISGRGDGVLVKDGILYAVTGQHAPGHTTTADLGFGLGYGLELWDVENPNNPERLSIVHFDGAEYIGTPDIWRVESYGDKYICATGVFGGAYIYDVSDSKKPLRVAQYLATGEATPNTRWKTTLKFAHQRDESGNHTALPLDQNKKGYPVVGCAIDGDRLYLGTADYGAENNLYEVKLPFDMGSRDPNGSDPDTQEEEFDGSYYDLDYKALFGESAIGYRTTGQVRAAAIKGDYMYVAAGTDGIIILDKATMTKVGSVAPLDITKDIQIYGDYLYTAESSEGVAIYKIDSNDPKKLTLIGNKAFEQNIVQLQLSPDARYALAHIGNTAAVLDLRDKTAPKMFKIADAFTMVYQNQMSIGCIGNRYLMIYTHVKNYMLCDFGENGCYEKPIITQWTDTTLPASGLCADGDNVIVGGGGKKIYRFNPADWDTTKPFTDQFEVYANYTNMGQCPVVIGDYMFVMHRAKGNSRILKMSEDRTTATTVKLNDGMHANPGMPVYDGERYYLPLGFAGIVSFDMADLES